MIYVVGKDPPGDTGDGRIDHVAFYCPDYSGVKAGLNACGAIHKKKTHPKVGAHQVFVETPEGMWLELILNYERDLKDTDQNSAT